MGHDPGSVAENPLHGLCVPLRGPQPSLVVEAVFGPSHMRAEIRNNHGFKSRIVALAPSMSSPDPISALKGDFVSGPPSKAMGAI